VTGGDRHDDAVIIDCAVYRDGKRIRLVAWRTRKAVYWVANTLTQSLSSQQMLGIATSLKRLGG